MAKSRIGTVTMVYPSTPEGMAVLAKRVIAFNTRELEYLLGKCPGTAAEKIAYVESLNGRVPWAKDTGDVGSDHVEKWCAANLGKRDVTRYGEE